MTHLIVGENGEQKIDAPDNAHPLNRKGEKDSVTILEITPPTDDILLAFRLGRAQTYNFPGSQPRKSTAGSARYARSLKDRKTWAWIYIAE